MKSDNKIKTSRRFFRIALFLLLTSFTIVYFAQATGYYEYEQGKKTFLTEEAIKQFEKDVSEGKQIDLENYLLNTNQDYQNNISGLNLTISETISKYARKGIEGIFSGIAKIIEE